MVAGKLSVTRTVVREDTRQVEEYGCVYLCRKLHDEKDHMLYQLVSWQEKFFWHGLWNSAVVHMPFDPVGRRGTVKYKDGFPTMELALKFILDDPNWELTETNISEMIPAERRKELFEGGRAQRKPAD